MYLRRAVLISKRTTQSAEDTCCAASAREARRSAGVGGERAGGAGDGARAARSPPGVHPRPRAGFFFCRAWIPLLYVGIAADLNQKQTRGPTQIGFSWAK